MNYFNCEQYLKNYPDLQHLNNPKLALRHYKMYGLLENKTDNKLISNFFPSQKKVVLFANVRDELNLKEWLIHHLNLGFDCIYLFDHLSKVPLEEELYNFDPRVTTIRISGNLKKIKSFCMELSLLIGRSINADWIIHLDADEFLVLNTFNSVKDLLYEFDNASMVGINWLMFGTNGHIKTPDGLVIENYTQCDSTLNPHIKSFVRPKEVSRILNPHVYDIINVNKFYSVNTKGIVPISPFIETKLKFLDTLAYIAHYHYQSEETYITRKINRLDDRGISKEFDKNIHNYHNEVENLTIKEKYLSIINEWKNNKREDDV